MSFQLFLGRPGGSQNAMAHANDIRSNAKEQIALEGLLLQDGSTGCT